MRFEVLFEILEANKVWTLIQFHSSLISRNSNTRSISGPESKFSVASEKTFLFYAKHQGPQIPTYVVHRADVLDRMRTAPHTTTYYLLQLLDNYVTYC